MGWYTPPAPPYSRDGLNYAMIPTPPPPDVWVWSPPEPGPPDLIPGLLPRHGHLLIAGETDVGKTTVALEIAQAALDGKPLWGTGPTATSTISRVAYIMGEHHESVVQSLWRLMDFGGEPAIKIRPPSLRRALVSRGVLMERGITDLKDWCSDSQAIIFDPLNAFTAGSDVENDAVNMRACINAMQDVAGGAALLILGHMGKPYYDQKRQKYEHRTSYASRGSSAIEDSVTSCYYMVAEGGPATEHFRLLRRKYKGDAPSFYLLRRDSRNRHTLLSGGKTRAEISAQAKQAAQARWGVQKCESDAE